PAPPATATGRNTGSTKASAAAGYSCPSSSTAERNALPCPGGGARCVTAMKMATTSGSAHISPIENQVRTRRTSLNNSTAITIFPDLRGPGGQRRQGQGERHLA